MRGAAAVLLLSVVIAGPARAQQAPGDLAVMTNGDRLSGTVKGLARGRLSFDVKAIGVVSISWSQVAQLTTATLLEVETTEGTRFVGTLQPGGPGKVLVVGDAGRQTIELGSIVGLAPLHRSLLQRLDGSFNIGGSYTQSSGVAQVSVAFAVSARRPSWEWRLKADDYLTVASEGVSSQRITGELGYSKQRSRNWAILGLAQVARNRDLGFDLRATLGTGLERRLVRSNQSELVVGGGLAVSREVPVEGGSSTAWPAVLAVRHSYFTYSRPKTSFETNFTAYPVLNEIGRWRLEANTSLTREVFKAFSLALTFYESYDNRPPSAEGKRNDAGSTLSVGFTF